MGTIRRVLLSVWAIPILLTGCLWSQTTDAKPLNSPPTLNLSFGPTQSNEEGKAAVNKLLQALGGAASVNAVKSMRQTVVAMRQGERVEIDQTIVYPDKQAQKMRIQNKTVLLVATRNDGFMVAGAQVQNLSSIQRDALDASLKHDPINVLQHINNPKYIFTAAGHESVGGVDATVVDVDADGIATRWWIGPDGKLLQERSSDISQGGVVQTMVYSVWKGFGALQFPTKYELYNEAGQPEMSMTLTAMDVNHPVSPKLFERP